MAALSSRRPARTRVPDAVAPARGREAVARNHGRRGPSLLRRPRRAGRASYRAAKKSESSQRVVEEATESFQLLQVRAAPARGGGDRSGRPC
jgi:hypothetical protein